MGSCHCLIRHPESAQERALIEEAVEYARKVSDSAGVMIGLAQLTGVCPSLVEGEQADAATPKTDEA